MKGELAALCRRQNISMNDAVRQMVGRVLSADVGLLPPIDADETDERLTVKVRLSPAEYKAVSQVAARMGFTMSRFFVAMVRAHATQNPQLGDREVAALEASNYQLAAVGRNLNQIARALNAEPGKVLQRDRLVLIDALRREIDAHLAHVHDMQRANLERWRR
ncbi:hypothetical protein WK76_25065 [Burkholderia ubonensis]|nr:hypothetical protein WK76_25065 [Burkholderia ubonensis]